MSLRAAWRGLLLLMAIVICLLRYGWIRGFGRVSPLGRALWLQGSCRLVVAAMGIRYAAKGRLPAGPTLIVANHLSYLDIVIFSACSPCAFVAKDEVAGWPVFGTLARLGGSIFIDRGSRLSAWDVAEAMGVRLAAAVPVLVFPEGTSTDGGEVMHFYSTLFEPAVAAGLSVTPAAVFYEPEGGAMERDLCWFGDDLFLPHLLRVLEAEGFRAVVQYGEPERFCDRRTAAWRSHDAVEGMRSQRYGLRR